MSTTSETAWPAGSSTAGRSGPPRARRPAWRRSSRIWRGRGRCTGTRSAPTTEMYTRCRAPARGAARTRLRALSSSPWALPAQCTIVPIRPPLRQPLAGGQVADHELDAVDGRVSAPAEHPQPAPASRSRGTTRRPSVPVPPVTRNGEVMVLSLSARPSRARSHPSGSAGRTDDTRRRDDVMDERPWPAERFEEAPRPAGGGLPMLGPAQRGRRRRPGDLDAPTPQRYRQRRELGRMADYGDGPGVPQHAPRPPVAARGASTRTCLILSSAPRGTNPEQEALLAEGWG